MNKILMGALGTIVTGVIVWGLLFMRDAAIARADTHWHTVLAFEQYEQAVVRQDAEKELRGLQREIADVKYRLGEPDVSPETKGRLEERLRVLEEQASELESKLSTAG